MPQRGKRTTSRTVRFPLQSASEFAISLDKIGLSPGRPFCVAFDIADTHGRSGFWQHSAKLKVPRNWQTEQLQYQQATEDPGRTRVDSALLNNEHIFGDCRSTARAQDQHRRVLPPLECGRR